MRESLKALKRIRQETCPSTYNIDFDKNACCNVIEYDLKVLEIIGKILSNEPKKDAKHFYYGLVLNALNDKIITFDEFVDIRYYLDTLNYLKGE